MENQPIVVKSDSSIATKLIGAVVVLIGGYFAYSKISTMIADKKRSGEYEKTGEDSNSNLAAQIYSEYKAFWVSDDKMIELFRQISDYKAVKAAYTKLSGGRDMMEDVRSHVKSGAMQQILNIIGVKGGAKGTTSSQSNDILTLLKNRKQGEDINRYLVTTKDGARLRKSAKVDSILSWKTITTGNNIIASLNKDMVVGLVDYITIKANGGKLLYDDSANVFFIPVLVLNNSGAFKNCVIAASNVIVKKPSEIDSSKRIIIGTAAYDMAVAGLGDYQETSLML